MAHSEISNFRIQPQELHLEWCWVAAAASVSSHYNNPTEWTQCRLAGEVKGKSNCCPPLGEHKNCYGPGNAGAALQAAGVDNGSTGEIDFERCREEIAAKQLIVVRKAPKGKSIGHTMVIWDAYIDNNQEIIWYGDPNGSQWDCHESFAVFSADTDGQEWTDTYFTKDPFPPKPMPPQLQPEAVPPSIKEYAALLETSAARPPKARSLGAQLPSVPTHGVLIATAAQLEQEGPEEFKFYGWRSLFKNSSGDLAAVITREEPSAPVGAGFVESRKGQQVDSFAALFEGSVPAGTPRLLRAPSIDLEAARFESEGGVIYIPMAPAPAGLTAGRIYPRDEFRRRMREILEEKDRLYRDHGFPPAPA